MATLEHGETSDLRLRPAMPSDAEWLKRWRDEWSVRRFQPLHDLSVPQLRSDVAAQRMRDLYRGRGDKFQWIIEEDAAPCGWITLVVSNWEHGLAEVGYALATAQQGRGLMTRALGMLVADLFTQTGLERIEARCAIDNAASKRVLEKAGFRHEGVLRSYFRLHGHRVDNHLYAILKEDWLAVGPL
jgi:RimJ/RimL family protein N-acetyltransferase